MKNILKNIVNKALCNFGLWSQKTNEVLCVCITEIRKYPNYSVCDTKIVTGKQYKEWFHYVDKIAEWAKDQGCKKMEIFARPGYVPMFKERGYLATHVQVEKKL
jgi:hypothetical protein